MTQPYGYDDDPADDNNNDIDEPQERHVRLTREQIRTLERDAKNARKATDELAQVRRELALTRAGVGDLTARQQKALLATIDGDLTAESVRAAAEELGFVKAPEPEPEPEITPERQAMERMSQASAGASDPSSEDSVARLQRAAEQGPEAFYAQLQADGAVVQSAS
jgi:membrane-bound ClpP family serine protease